MPKRQFFALTDLRGMAWDEPTRWEKPWRLEISGAAPRDLMLPRPIGHCWWTEESERQVVYDMAGPTRWPLMKMGTSKLEDVIVYDRRGPPGAFEEVVS